MVYKEPSTLAKKEAKFLYGLFCNGLWHRTAECHKKETRIKREGKFEEKHKLGFLSSGYAEYRLWSTTRNKVG